MLQINNLTNDAYQQFTLTGIPGTQIICSLQYMPRIQRWVMGVQSGDVSVQGIFVVESPNFLRQWKNLFNFGIACTSTVGLDPYTLDDFSNQIMSLYLLNSDDVASIEKMNF